MKNAGNRFGLKPLNRDTQGKERLYEMGDGYLLFRLLEFLNVHRVLFGLPFLYRRFYKRLSLPQFLDRTRLFKFSFEFFQSALDVFSFLQWDNYHNFS